MVDGSQQHRGAAPPRGAGRGVPAGPGASATVRAIRAQPRPSPSATPRMSSHRTTAHRGQARGSSSSGTRTPRHRHNLRAGGRGEVVGTQLAGALVGVAEELGEHDQEPIPAPPQCGGPTAGRDSRRSTTPDPGTDRQGPATARAGPVSDRPSRYPARQWGGDDRSNPPRGGGRASGERRDGGWEGGLVNVSGIVAEQPHSPAYPGPAAARSCSVLPTSTAATGVCSAAG